MWYTIGRILSLFCRDERGVSIIVFALTLPVMLAASGMAVDLAQAYNMKVRLGNALDKAALAAGTTSGTEAEIEEQVLRFVEANFPEEKLGETLNVNAVVNEMFISVTADARVDTLFMRIFGYNDITVREESEVVRELSGVEVVLVLDVTGSMAGNNITALRTASTSFLNIMFGRIRNSDYIRIGIVPFSNSVNVGAAGLTDNFVRRPTTDDYISPTSNIQYSSSTTGTTNNWKGCILERTYPADTTDDATPQWNMYRWPRTCTRTSNGVCQTWSGEPNNLCPNSRIVPLTDDQAVLQATINNLAVAGNTYGNVGMAWGWRVISPTAPFTQGVEYDDPDWSKVVIMMTDGDNTMHGTYSVYGRTSSHNIDANDLDDRFAEICQNMKDDGLTIYTITFQSGINNATRQIFRQCASSPDYYFNAPSNADLITAFERIANQLSQLHLSK